MTKRQMNWPFIQKKMVVVHNGRTITTMHDRSTGRRAIIESVPSLSLYADDFWSVTIAELHPVKQHDVTIRALQAVVTAHPNVRHIIIGGGQEHQKLEELVTECGLTENVFFTGALDEAAQYLHAFDLFVLSSRSEALAYVIVEACAAGLPIIASNVGGIPEIITDTQQGVLVLPGKSKALAQAYSTLYGDPELRAQYAKKALNRASAFTIEKMIQETTKVYS